MFKTLEEVIKKDELYKNQNFYTTFKVLSNTEFGVWGPAYKDFKLDRKGSTNGPTIIGSNVICRQYDRKGRDNGVEFWLEPG